MDHCNNTKTLLLTTKLTQYRSKTIKLNITWGVKIKWFAITTQLDTLKTRLAINASPKSLHQWTPVTPRLRLFKVRNPLEQASSVFLVQATPGWTLEHMASHLAPTSASTIVMSPSAPHPVAGGPKPCYGHLVRNWTSDHQDIFSQQEQDIRMSRTSESSSFQTGLTPIFQDKPKFGNFGSLNGLNGFLDTSVQPMRVEPMI